MSEKIIENVISGDQDFEEDVQKDQYALIEVICFFMSFFLFIKYLETTWFGIVQLKFLGWDFFAHLMMVVLPLLVLFFSKRSLADIGLSRDHLHDPEVRRISEIVFFEIGLIWVIGILIPHLMVGKTPIFLLPPDSFATSLNVNWVVAGFTGWALTIVFTVVFCGIGEEVLFRGYIQGRLNKMFGRPFNILGVRFGWGLIITSVIFGGGHVFSFFNPFVRDPLNFDPNFTAGAVHIF